MEGNQENNESKDKQEIKQQSSVSSLQPSLPLSPPLLPEQQEKKKESNDQQQNNEQLLKIEIEKLMNEKQIIELQKNELSLQILHFQTENVTQSYQIASLFSNYFFLWIRRSCNKQIFQ